LGSVGTCEPERMGLRLQVSEPSQHSHCSEMTNRVTNDSHDYNDGLGTGRNFTERFPDWETGQVQESWEQYAEEEFGECFSDQHGGLLVNNSEQLSPMSL
jgi:hypothetical protein